MLETLKARLGERFPSLVNPNLDSTNYEVRKEKCQAPSMLALIVKRLARQLALMPAYFILVIPLAIIGAMRMAFFLSGGDRCIIKKYCHAYWYYPSLCIHKSIEGLFFSSLEVRSPSADIGCEDGCVSELHFSGTVFDLGMEYIDERLPEKPIFRNVMQGKVPGLPVEMHGRYNTVCLVHVIDHIEDLPAALKDLRSILSPDGILALSGLCNAYRKNLDGLTVGLMNERWLNHKKGIWHFLTLEQWRETFEASGFEVVKLHGFLGGLRGRLWTVLHALFEINGSNDCYYAANKLKLIPEPLRRVFCVFPVMWLTAFFFSRRPHPDPCHFYAELRAG